MKTYRHKRPVEALLWTDTDEDRERFSAWFEAHGVMFETEGPIAVLPDIGLRADDPYGTETDDLYRAAPGEWVVWMDGEFVAMNDTTFRGTYEEVA